MIVWMVISAFIIISMGCIALTILNRMVAQATPPEGFIFERLPVVTGVYEWSNLPNNRPSSRVGNYYMSCLTPDFIQGIGTIGRYGSGFSGPNQMDCGLAELNGKMVQVEQVWTPTISWFTPAPTVSKISVGGKIYFERPDVVLRKQWIERSYQQVSSLCYQVFGLLIAIAFSLFTRPLFKNQAPTIPPKDNPWQT